MGIPLQQWDEEIAPVLHDIEAQARWCILHADRVRNLIHRLKMVPDFDSQARHELMMAQEALSAAADAINSTIIQYDGLPKDE